MNSAFFIFLICWILYVRTKATAADDRCFSSNLSLSEKTINGRRKLVLDLNAVQIACSKCNVLKDVSSSVQDITSCQNPSGYSKSDLEIDLELFCQCAIYTMKTEDEINTTNSTTTSVTSPDKVSPAPTTVSTSTDKVSPAPTTVSTSTDKVSPAPTTVSTSTDKRNAVLPAVITDTKKENTVSTNTENKNTNPTTVSPDPLKDELTRTKSESQVNVIVILLSSLALAFAVIAFAIALYKCHRHGSYAVQSPTSTRPDAMELGDQY